MTENRRGAASSLHADPRRTSCAPLLRIGRPARRRVADRARDRSPSPHRRGAVGARSADRRRRFGPRKESCRGAGRASRERAAGQESSCGTGFVVAGTHRSIDRRGSSDGGRARDAAADRTLTRQAHHRRSRLAWALRVAGIASARQRDRRGHGARDRAAYHLLGVDRLAPSGGTERIPSAVVATSPTGCEPGTRAPGASVGRNSTAAAMGRTATLGRSTKKRRRRGQRGFPGVPQRLAILSWRIRSSVAYRRYSSL